jgi:hypothetical protein
MGGRADLSSLHRQEARTPIGASGHQLIGKANPVPIKIKGSKLAIIFLNFICIEKAILFHLSSIIWMH